MTTPPTEITITVDGQQVKTRPGKMVLEACIEAGLYVPYLCYHPGLKPFGACRMCVVEIEGQRGTPASCTVPVADGMVVRTQTHQAYQVRRSVMETLISEHPHGCLTCHRISLCGPEDICLRHVAVNDRCVVCPKNERCELKDTTRYLTMDVQSPLPYRYRNLEIETGDPFYDRDYNLCIVCGRCVRVCSEVRGDDALAYTERSAIALVGTSHGGSLLESGCEGCGACVDVCPVGALVEREYKWEKPVEVVRSVCPTCPVGCQVNYEVNRYGVVIRAVPELTAEANHGQGCFRGKFGFSYVNSSSRLKRPLVRKNGHMVETSWKEALTAVAQGLTRYRGQQVAVLLSPRASNEDAYVTGKFARLALKTNNVDIGSDLRPGVVEGLADTLGVPAGTSPVWDLEGAATIVVVNANLTEAQNVVGVPIKRAAKAGKTILVLDPREVELTRYAAQWLRPVPGTELVLLAGLLKAVLEGNLVDQEFVGQHVAGLEELRRSLASVDLEQVAAQTGVTREQVEQAARTMAQGPTAFVYALDNIPVAYQREAAHALADLALLTGNVGKPNTGLYPLRLGGNDQGAWDVGCAPHYLPGYRRVDDAAAREQMAQLWLGEVPAGEGLGAWNVLQAVDAGTVKAMLLLGGDLPALEGNALAALDKLEFLVVMDTFPGPAAERAHVVLPLATFAEKDGTITNLERRVQRLRPALRRKVADARAQWWTLCQVAQAMGVSGFDFETPDQVAEEIARVVPQYGGITHARLEELKRPTPRPSSAEPLPTQLLHSVFTDPGLMWPCPTPVSEGTRHLYAEGFPGGKARLQPVQAHAFDFGQGGEWPLLLVPGRTLLQTHHDMTVHKSPGRLNRAERTEWLELHPQDAQSLGVQDGDPVVVETPTSRVEGVVKVNGMHRGTVGVTYLFGTYALQLEASEDPDPMARVPLLPVEPARLRRQR